MAKAWQCLHRLPNAPLKELIDMYILKANVSIAHAVVPRRKCSADATPALPLPCFAAP